MSISIPLADYRWLLTEHAALWLQEAGYCLDRPLYMAARLRKVLTLERACLVQEQARLRERAREKFAAAERMFFTPLGLQQSTDETVAAYKASRFPQGTRTADLCCGIGGDLLGLTARGPCVGVDRDAVAALFAEANCRACGSSASVQTCDCLEATLDDCVAVHLDPDRRPDGWRTTHVQWHEPSLDQIEQLRARHPNLAIKLAPGTELPNEWRGQAEWEWISRDRQCRQLVAWFGSLTTTHELRRATLLDRGPQPVRTIVGDGTLEPRSSDRLGRYLFEADAAVLAAGLNGQLASEHNLSAVSAGIAYLTGDNLIPDAALATFEIQDVLPLDIKTVRGLLRERRIGRLEIKKRGVTIDPEQLRDQLRLRGEASATLIVTPHHERTLALLCQRIPRSA